MTTIDYELAKIRHNFVVEISIDFYILFLFE